MDRYAVMGNPIAHSKSPRIHQAFAEQTREDLEYEALLVDPDGFPVAVETFRSGGGKGLNITVPFKQEAWSLVSSRSPRSELAGAVNTIWFDDEGAMLGDTTDGAGLIRDLLRNGVALEDRRILVLGAGGAVSGVLADIIDQSPASLTFSNRTLQRAAALRERFERPGVEITVAAFSALEGKQFDVIINGTSASLFNEQLPLPAGIFGEDACAYDMVYGDTEPCFLAWARQKGAGRTLDGLGMLVEQAAESFYIWRGVRPDTAPVIDMLRASSPPF